MPTSLRAIRSVSWTRKPWVLARVAEYRRKSGQQEAAIYGTGQIGGYPIVICALDFTFPVAAWAPLSGRR